MSNIVSIHKTAVRVYEKKEELTLLDNLGGFSLSLVDGQLSGDGLPEDTSVLREESGFQTNFVQTAPRVSCLGTARDGSSVLTMMTVGDGRSRLDEEGRLVEYCRVGFGGRARKL